MQLIWFYFLVGACVRSVKQNKIIADTEKAVESAKELNAHKYFNNPTLSDIIIECGGNEFYAHKFMLSCKDVTIFCA